MLLPEAKKAIFHSHQYLGEISLENYPFQRSTQASDLEEEDSNPSIKMYDVHSFKVKGKDGNWVTNHSTSSTLVRVQPAYSGNEWTDRLFLLLTDNESNGVGTSLRIDVVSAS